MKLIRHQRIGVRGIDEPDEQHQDIRHATEGRESVDWLELKNEAARLLFEKDAIHICSRHPGWGGAMDAEVAR